MRLYHHMMHDLVLIDWKGAGRSIPWRASGLIQGNLSCESSSQTMCNQRRTLVLE